MVLWGVSEPEQVAIIEIILHTHAKAFSVNLWLFFWEIARYIRHDFGILTG
jgi:hypothetical protein